MRTAYPIVYTSADSVFQIAAHEEIIPIDELYRICIQARALLQGEYAVGRVIARPFVGSPGAFERTARRHDYSLQPDHLIMDDLQQAGCSVTAVGKIKDLYDGRGIGRHYPTQSNEDGMEKILQALREVPETGLIFANLVDFDMVYGHRNDPLGYGQALEDFDTWLPALLKQLDPADMLMISADHGCDPTTISTDHSREYVPLLAWGAPVKPGVNLGCRESMADLGQTAADFLGVATDPGLAGISFWPEIEKQ